MSMSVVILVIPSALSVQVVTSGIVRNAELVTSHGVKRSVAMSVQLGSKRMRRRRTVTLLLTTSCVLRTTTLRMTLTLEAMFLCPEELPRATQR